MRLVLLAALLLAPGCILLETGPHGKNDDGCYQEDWGNGGGGGQHGDNGGAAAECEQIERVIAELEAQQAELEALLADSAESEALLNQALTLAQQQHDQALTDAERQRDDALAAIAAEHYAVLDGLMERITLALAEGRYEDAAADTAVYLAAEETLARQEAEAWALWQEAVAAADEALAQTEARVAQALDDLAAGDAHAAEQALQLEAEIGRLNHKAAECWERLGGPR